jgi:hypothetical protein
MEQSVGDDQGVNPEEEKAARRTLRAMKKVQSAPATESVAPLAEGSFSATIRHFSGLFLCHKVGERKLGAVHDIDESCLFVFEPFKDVQMGRPRFGWRVKTAQGAFLVAVLGRRCTSRLVMQNEVPLPGAGDAHNKFFMEQTNLFEIGSYMLKVSFFFFFCSHFPRR